MHISHESYYAIIEQRSDGNSKAKKINKKTFPFIEVGKHI